MQKLRVASAASLAEGKTAKFEFVRDRIRCNGFVARFRGQLVAYENICRHLPLTLDYDDNHFFTQEGTQFLCQNHGAIFEPASGLCVRGPCQGASLKPLRIEEAEGGVWLVDSAPDG